MEPNCFNENPLEWIKMLKSKMESAASNDEVTLSVLGIIDEV